MHVEGLGRHQELDAFVTEDSLHFLRDVGILAAHQLRPGLDNRHAAAEAAISLGQFEADIAAPEHDQMRRQVVELQSLDMGERPGGLEARNVRDCRVRSEVEENLVARQHPRAAVIQVHLERFRCHETPGPHDQFGAARLVVLQMRGDFAFNHVALALANLRHVGRDGTGRRAELRCVMRQMRDPRAPNLVLAGQAGDVGAGAADPPALDDGSPSPRSRHMPSQQLAALSAAKDQDFKPVPVET